MLPEGALRANQVWKRFRADRNRSLLRDELARMRARKIDESRGWTWAVSDVSFDVMPGESIALIGSNGSGKSTMLKMLVGVMFPYAGRIEATGRIGALIEVRAGIHPDLTARENVFMYGNLLGLSRNEVGKRFDDIISFAGLENAVERQVKFFSSGMSMRLGFAVAAFLDPAILVVDEVLAVGDASFQQSCLDRMRDVLAAGTTLVYVSHDLATVEAMCRRAVWLDQGVMRAAGPTRDVLRAYRQSVEMEKSDDQESSPVHISGVQLQGPDGGPPTAGESLEIRLTLGAAHTTKGRIVLGMSEGTATPIFLVQNDIEIQQHASELRCSLRGLPLSAGKYAMWAAVVDSEGKYLLPWRPRADFDVGGSELREAPTGVVRLSPIFVQATWDD